MQTILFLTPRGAKNQSWYLAERYARTVWTFWRFFEGKGDTRTRGTWYAISEGKRCLTCCYGGSCGVCDTNPDGNSSRKIHFECLDTGTSSIGTSSFLDQVTCTVQSNCDLETSWTDAYSPQTVPLQNDVAICLKIDCVNRSRVSQFERFGYLDGLRQQSTHTCITEKLQKEDPHFNKIL